MPRTGETIAPIMPIFQSENEETARRTPSENSSRGTATSPSSLDGEVERLPQLDFHQAQRYADQGCGDNRIAPQVPPVAPDDRAARCPGRSAGCSRRKTAPPPPATRSSPKASTISGSPMLPALTNITGGTKVLACSRSRIASPQASRPLPSMTARRTEQPASDSWPRSKLLVDHRRNHQRRNEHIHVQFVGEGHVYAATIAAVAGVGPADRHHGENREDDGNRSAAADRMLPDITARSATDPRSSPVRPAWRRHRRHR